MRQYLVFAAGIIAVCGTIPYIIDTIRGKTRPNIVTWLTWTIINIINTFAAFSQTPPASRWLDEFGRLEGDAAAGYFL